MKKQRVVITGMDAITPIGSDLISFWENSLNGVSGVDTIDFIDIPDNLSQVAGMAKSFMPETLDFYRTTHQNDRAYLLAAAATQGALLHADLDLSSIDRQQTRTACILSSAVAQIASMERIYCELTDFGSNRLSGDKQLDPRFDYNVFQFHDITAKLSKAFEKFNFHCLLPTGCAGGVDAINYATQAIRNHKADVIITGATEAPITPLVVAAFNKIGATAKHFNHEPSKASRPFDTARNGFVLGEGCGILILEALSHALERGATIHAELIGIGSNNNTYHMTDIPEDGNSIARSCQLALDDANLRADQIDYINAHGSSTRQNDLAESNAFNSIFGTRASKIPVTSIKSQIGHSLAASNAIEIISAVESLKHEIIPPTINLDQQDPAINLNVVNEAEHFPNMNYVLKTSSGFSGIHSSVIIAKYRGDHD